MNNKILLSTHRNIFYAFRFTNSTRITNRILVIKFKQRIIARKKNNLLPTTTNLDKETTIDIPTTVTLIHPTSPQNMPLPTSQWLTLSSDPLRVDRTTQQTFPPKKVNGNNMKETALKNADPLLTSSHRTLNPLEKN